MVLYDLCLILALIQLGGWKHNQLISG